MCGSYWICQVPSMELIVLPYFQDYLPVLAFVTRHLIGSVHIYLVYKYIRIQDVSSDVHAGLTLFSTSGIRAGSVFIVHVP